MRVPLLPPYLGLGRLDKDSIAIANGVISARYVDGADFVYEVVIDGDSHRLAEYVDGAEYYVSDESSLRNAFLSHLLSLLPYEHPRYERLESELTAGRPVVMRFAHEPEAVVFPTGYVFLLHLPVTAGNRARWEAFKTRVEAMGDLAPMRFDGEREGILLRLLASDEVASDEVTSEMVIVAECSTSLSHVREAVTLICQSDVLLPGAAYGLIVTELTETISGRIAIHDGDRSAGELTFALVALDALDIGLDQAQAQFAAASRAYLDGVQPASTDDTDGHV